MNDVLIKVLSSQEYILSSNDTNSINSIAPLCPEIYGKGVLIARAFISQNQRIAYENNDTCGTNMPLLISSILNQRNFNKNELSTLEKTKSESIKIEVFDINGKMWPISQTLNNLNYNELPNGFFIIRKSINNKLISSEKIINLK